MFKLASAMLTGALGLALTCGLALAQDDGPSGKKGTANRSAKAVGETMTVTGCLQKDTKEANEHLIKGENGETWGLKTTSSSPNLSDHVNHKVTITGKVAKESHESEAGDLNVSRVKMVSTTCQ